MRIFLIGYMATGKSWLGKELASLTGLKLLDLDELFEERFRITILDFFTKYGEELFRKLERDILMESFDLDNLIVATGGGIPCFFDNMDLILKSGRSIYLRMEISELVQRIKGIKKKRPLLENVDPAGLENFVRAQMAIREPYYNRANYVFNGPDYPIDEILKVIREG